MTTAPLLAHSREELRDALAERGRAAARRRSCPTMGALHAGHASLMARARDEVGSGRPGRGLDLRQPDAVRAR